MTRLASLNILRQFRRLKDPRRTHGRRHLLGDIIAIVLCATIAGSKEWQEMVIFAQEREAWLRTFLELPNGIPSHDTLERVFSRLDPVALQECLRRWLEQASRALGLRQVAIDGKTLRASGGAATGLPALHLVSAWATDAKLTLGQVAVADKANEIVAIPQLLQLLYLKGALVTLDAMGCQKEIAAQIVAKEGDYVLVLKDNHPKLLSDVQQRLNDLLEKASPELKHDSHQTEERGHGRQERRTVTVLYEPQDLHDQASWPKLGVIGICHSEGERNGQPYEATRYFLGSRRMSAAQYAEALRQHWGIENRLHWHLDVTFGEDANRTQDRQAATNLALFRKLALSLTQQHPGKDSLKSKIYRASLSPTFLQEILDGGPILGKV